MRAPSAMPAEKIDAFVSEHAGWIRKQFTAYERRAERFSSVREGQTILLDGKECPLVCGTARNSEKGGTVCLKNMRGAQAFFTKTRAFLLVEKTAALSRRAGLYPEDVSVRDFKARWGSCDAQKRRGRQQHRREHHGIIFVLQILERHLFADTDVILHFHAERGDLRDLSI